MRRTYRRQLNNRSRSRRNRRRNGGVRILVLFGVLLFLAAAAVGVFRLAEKLDPVHQAEAAMLAQSEPMSKEDIKKGLMQVYDWNITVSNPSSIDHPEYSLSNLIEDDIDRLVDEIYTSRESNRYELKLEIDESELEKEFRSMRKLWNRAVVNAEVTAFDPVLERLIYGEGHDGLAINSEKLAADIRSAVERGDLDARIRVQVDPVKADFSKESMDDLYSIIGSFETVAVDNENRNSNLRLACQALDGTLLRPGEEFSFNGIVGERSTEKGYRAAGAYRDGVLIQEEGGGVCQVASTLYNAVINAGFVPTERHAHTYEPTYVTPGEDSMVDYDHGRGPDMKFVNTSDASIVIRAAFGNGKVSCFIIGIPFLEEGEKHYMESRKLYDVQQQTQIVEDRSLAPGSRVVDSTGSPGSVWETDFIVSINGVEESRERFHTSHYQPHKGKIRVNSTRAAATNLSIPNADIDSNAAMTVETSPVSEEGPGAPDPSEPIGPAFVEPDASVREESPEQQIP